MPLVKTYLSWLIIAASLVAAPAAMAQEPELERAIKATYLVKLAPFVQWPEEEEADSSYFTICIGGHDPFGTLLDTAAADISIQDRPVTIRRLAYVTAEDGCQMLYAAGSEIQSARQMVEAVAGTPVLTVTDMARRNGDHGIIHFVERENRIRFSVNLERARGNDLGISSKLISLAISVTPEEVE